MKKKLALFLAAAMTVGAIPQAAFASTENAVSKIASVETDKEFYADENSTAVLNIYCKATDEGDATVTIEDVTKTILHLQQKFR